MLHISGFYTSMTLFLVGIACLAAATPFPAAANATAAAAGKLLLLRPATPLPRRAVAVAVTPSPPLLSAAAFVPAAAPAANATQRANWPLPAYDAQNSRYFPHSLPAKQPPHLLATVTGIGGVPVSAPVTTSDGQLLFVATGGFQAVSLATGEERMILPGQRPGTYTPGLPYPMAIINGQALTTLAAKSLCFLDASFASCAHTTGWQEALTLLLPLSFTSTDDNRIMMALRDAFGYVSDGNNVWSSFQPQALTGYVYPPSDAASLQAMVLGTTVNGEVQRFNLRSRQKDTLSAVSTAALVGTPLYHACLGLLLVFDAAHVYALPHVHATGVQPAWTHALTPFARDNVYPHACAFGNLTFVTTGDPALVALNAAGNVVATAPLSGTPSSPACSPDGAFLAHGKSLSLLALNGSGAFQEVWTTRLPASTDRDSQTLVAVQASGIVVTILNYCSFLYTYKAVPSPSPSVSPLASQSNTRTPTPSTSRGASPSPTPSTSPIPQPHPGHGWIIVVIVIGSVTGGTGTVFLCCCIVSYHKRREEERMLRAHGTREANGGSVLPVLLPRLTLSADRNANDEAHSSSSSAVLRGTYHNVVSEVQRFPSMDDEPGAAGRFRAYAQLQHRLLQLHLVNVHPVTAVSASPHLPGPSVKTYSRRCRGCWLWWLQRCCPCCVRHCCGCLETYTPLRLGYCVVSHAPGDLERPWLSALTGGSGRRRGDLLRALHALAEALQALHAHGIAHGAINMEAVTVRHDHATLAWQHAGLHLLHPQRLPNAMVYCAPELWRFNGAQQALSREADVWAFGHFMAAALNRGLHPWHHLGPAELARRYTNGEYPPLPPDLPATLSQLVSRCCSQVPRHRPRMQEVAESLQALTQWHELVVTRGQSRPNVRGRRFRVPHWTWAVLHGNAAVQARWVREPGMVNMASLLLPRGFHAALPQLLARSTGAGFELSPPVATPPLEAAALRAWNLLSLPTRPIPGFRLSTLMLVDHAEAYTEDMFALIAQTLLNRFQGAHNTASPFFPHWRRGGFGRPFRRGGNVYVEDTLQQHRRRVLTHNLMLTLSRGHFLGYLPGECQSIDDNDPTPLQIHRLYHVVPDFNTAMSIARGNMVPFANSDQFFGRGLYFSHSLPYVLRTYRPPRHIVRDDGDSASTSASDGGANGANGSTPATSTAPAPTAPAPTAPGSTAQGAAAAPVHGNCSDNVYVIVALAAFANPYPVAEAVDATDRSLLNKPMIAPYDAHTVVVEPAGGHLASMADVEALCREAKSEEEVKAVMERRVGGGVGGGGGGGGGGEGCNPLIPDAGFLHDGNGLDGEACATEVVLTEGSPLLVRAILCFSREDIAQQQ